MNFLNEQEAASAQPLKKISLTGALVLRISESEFMRLLRKIEYDFPEAKVIHKDLCPGMLWIRREGENQQ